VFKIITKIGYALYRSYLVREEFWTTSYYTNVAFATYLCQK